MSLKKLHGTPLWGLLMLLSAAGSMGVMAVLVKAALGPISGLQAGFVRFASGLIVCIGVHLWHSKLRPKNREGLFLRALYGGMSVCCYYFALTHLPVGLATLLVYTSPIFTALYAVRMLGEKLQLPSRLLLMATMCGIAAVILATVPGHPSYLRWEFIALVGACMSGVSLANIAELTRNKEGPWEIYTAYCLGGLSTTSVPWLFDGWSWVSPNGLEWFFLLAAAGVSLLAHWLLRYAYQFLPGETAATAGAFQFTSVVAMVFDAWLFGQKMNGFALTGTIAIVSGVVIDSVLRARLKKKAKKTQSAAA